jgi:hypothetical protein
MPRNREVNNRFGVFKNLCCGEEIVIPEGQIFPDCPNHPNLTTIWKPVVSDRIIRLPAAVSESNFKRVARFRVGDRVQIVGVDPRKGQQGTVVRIFATPGDYVCRYEVRFADETAISRYFGFQLELVQSKSA